MRFLLTSPPIPQSRFILAQRWAVLLSLTLVLVGVAPVTAARAAFPPASGPTPRQVQVGPGASPADPLPVPARASAGVRYFAETGHTLAHGFRDYWEQNHRATLFGLPLTEEFTEYYSDGAAQTVQYFERAVLEYDPTAPPGHQITPRAVGPLLLGDQHFTPPARQSGQLFPRPASPSAVSSYASGAI